MRPSRISLSYLPTPKPTVSFSMAGISSPCPPISGPSLFPLDEFSSDPQPTANNTAVKLIAVKYQIFIPYTCFAFMNGNRHSSFPHRRESTYSRLYFFILSNSRFAGNPTSWKPFSHIKSLMRSALVSLHFGSQLASKSASRPAFIISVV